MATVSLPLTRPGMGWLLGGAAGAVALGAVAWSAGRNHATNPQESEPAPGRRRIGAERVVWAVATLALLAVGMVRAAGWLFALCLLTACLTASVAATGGRSVRSLLLAMVIPPLAAFRALPWAATGLVRLGRARTGRSAARVAATVAASLALLVLFGALFASADVAFGDLLGRALPEVGWPTVARWVFLFPAVGFALLGGAFVLTAAPDLGGLEAPAKRRFRRLEWAVPLALLDVLFASFVLVQLTVLFGGAAHVLRTSGMTFAQYARTGFWQLLAVTALTLLVLAVAARWAPRHTRTDRLLIRSLLGSLALLTLVVVASALYRMNLYQQAYGFTRLRLLVSACELWLGLVFVLVLIAGVRLRADWLPRLVVGSAVLALLGIAAINPDRFIADRNIDRYQTSQKVDISYLSQLSADAVPAFNRLPTPMRNCAVSPVAAELARHPDSWREANLARTRARRLLLAEPVPTRALTCSVSAWRD